MIRIYESWNDTNKLEVFDAVQEVLSKRQHLWERYSRGIDLGTSTAAYHQRLSSDGTETAITEGEIHLQILFEKFIVDIASGYLSGDIAYDVDQNSDTEANVAKRIFNRDKIDAKYAEEIKYIINTIAACNRDQVELTTLFRHALLYGSCYERLREDDKNMYRYTNLDALNTVAIWNDDVEPKLVAVVSQFKRRKNNVDYYYYRVYLKDRIEVYSRATKKLVNEPELKKEEDKPHNWGRVPVVVYESDFSIIDRCSDLIISYEALLNNVRNTYQYNDTDCKMKIVGYRPQNPITIPNPKYKEGGSEPQMILNPARILEDQYTLKGKTFYVQEGGDADWLTKPIQATDVTTMLKYYVDAIFQMCGIPNTADLAFNSSDLNASAIDRKFYVMNIALSDVREGVTSLIRDRLEMLLERINTKHSTHYSVENLTITIHTNLPSMTDENIDRMLQLDGILSEETVITKLGYDYQTEKNRKEQEVDDGVGKVTKLTKQNDEVITEEGQDSSNGAEDTDATKPGDGEQIQRNNKKKVQTGTNGKESN